MHDDAHSFGHRDFREKPELLSLENRKKTKKQKKGKKSKKIKKKRSFIRIKTVHFPPRIRTTTRIRLEIYAKIRNPIRPLIG